MYLVKNNQITHRLRKSIDQPLYEEVVAKIDSNDYDYAVFFPESTTWDLLYKIPPEKCRIFFYGEFRVLPLNTPIKTYMGTLSHQHLEILSKNPSNIIPSKLGFIAKANLIWHDPDAPSKLEDLKAALSDQRIFFYGKKHHLRDMMIDWIEEMGYKVVHSDIGPKTQKLLDVMFRKKCFAALSMDGGSVCCYRDWELALAGVPAIRITESEINYDLIKESRPSIIVKPFDEESEHRFNDFITNFDETLRKIPEVQQHALILNSSPETSRLKEIFGEEFTSQDC